MCFELLFQALRLVGQGDDSTPELEPIRATAHGMFGDQGDHAALRGVPDLGALGNYLLTRCVRSASSGGVSFGDLVLQPSHSVTISSADGERL